MTDLAPYQIDDLLNCPRLLWLGCLDWSGANLVDAKYDDAAKWPLGLDQVAAGAKKVYQEDVFDETGQA